MSKHEKVSRICYECQSTAIGRREAYPYTECGLKHIVLKDVLVFRCSECGAEQVDIPNMDGLHRSIALRLLCKKTLLSRDEIRFLRKVAGFTATELASNLGVTKTAVSRWENGAKIGGQSDRSIRILCGLAILGEIVEERSGAVPPEDVAQTLEKLKSFLLAFNPKKTLSQIEDDRQESDRLFIDPEYPALTLLPSKDSCSPIQ
jgi:putative zinc finger/helix-turn-helix YgiT family protein